MPEAIYIHGESDVESERLLEQAEILSKWVLDDLRLSGRVLEVGIGVGAETRLYRKRWPVQVVGVDYSMHQLARARNVLGPEVPLLRASGARLPLASASFDHALCIWLLEHVPDPQAVMRELQRCLRPGGRLWAQEVYNTSLYLEPRRPIIEKYFAAVSELQRQGGGHPEIAARLPILAERAGLRIDDFHWSGPHGDARDRLQCVRLIRYFEGLLRSAEPQLRAAGAFPVEEIPEVWAAFDEIVADPDAMLSYTSGKLIASKV